MINIPTGATHKAETYGKTHYYRKVVWEEVGQFSELPFRHVKWYWWDKGNWQDQAETGFSPRRCEGIENPDISLKESEINA